MIDAITLTSLVLSALALFISGMTVGITFARWYLR